MQLGRGGSSRQLSGTMLWYPADRLCEVCRHRQTSIPNSRLHSSQFTSNGAEPSPSARTPLKGDYITGSNIFGQLQAQAARRKLRQRLRMFGLRQGAVLQRYITFIFVCTFFLIRKLGFNVTSISTLLLYRLKPIRKLFPRARNLWLEVRRLGF